MLLLWRKELQRIRLVTPAGEVVWLTLADVERGKARLAFDAPDGVKIMREELLPPGERYLPTRKKP
jgi:sRNA-binding carbon storage regulator CsrA